MESRHFGASSRRREKMHAENRKQKVIFSEKEAEELQDDLERNGEMYVPRVPIKFDEQTGKVLLYHSDQLKQHRRTFKFAMLLPTLALYCGVRAVQKRSWWRILLWSFPSFYASRILYNGMNMMSVAVTKMELKEDGETIVLQTMLGEEYYRKIVVNVRDIEPHEDPKSIFEILLSGIGDNFFEDHMPVKINGGTYLFYKRGFLNTGDPALVKAILNGYPIDTQHKQELTEELLAEDLSTEKRLVVLDI